MFLIGLVYKFVQYSNIGYQYQGNILERYFLRQQQFSACTLLVSILKLENMTTTMLIINLYYAITLIIFIVSIQNKFCFLRSNTIALNNFCVPKKTPEIAVPIHNHIRIRVSLNTVLRIVILDLNVGWQIDWIEIATTCSHLIRVNSLCTASQYDDDDNFILAHSLSVHIRYSFKCVLKMSLQSS